MRYYKAIPNWVKYTVLAIVAVSAGLGIYAMANL